LSEEVWNADDAEITDKNGFFAIDELKSIVEDNKSTPFQQ